MLVVARRHEPLAAARGHEVGLARRRPSLDEVGGGEEPLAANRSSSGSSRSGSRHKPSCWGCAAIGIGETWAGQPHTCTRPLAVSVMKIMFSRPDARRRSGS